MFPAHVVDPHRKRPNAMHSAAAWETALTIQPALPFPELDPLTSDLPLSVWTTGQQDSRTQRRGRYVPASMAHPGKMLPAIARHAIEHYTSRDDLIIDPMCGIGTTLVEAIHLGRDAIGVEYEQRWADLALENIDHAADQGATGGATAICGDARRIDELVSKDVVGKAALVLTSPPYGDSLHGQVRTTRDSGRPNVEKFNHRYSTDRGNLAHSGLEDLMAGFTEILAGCRRLLRPDGFLAITVRPIRRHGGLIDIPSMALDAAVAAGFTPFERCVALLAKVSDSGLTARASFFQLVNTANARKNGQPLHVPAFEDVLILRAQLA